MPTEFLSHVSNYHISQLNFFLTLVTLYAIMYRVCALIFPLINICEMK